MYNSYFGFQTAPFSLSPDPSFLYRGEQHAEALANLIYSFHSRAGLTVLTGEIGTGKTMLLECFRDFLCARQVKFGCIFHSRVSVREFFEMLAYDFSLPCDRTSKTEVLAALSEMLVKQATRGRSGVLIIDEAQNLEWEVLEEIRLLGNLETRQGKLLQIVLAGQSNFAHRLDSPDLRELKQRVLLRCTLHPLKKKETLEYVERRLFQAGMPDQSVFPPHLLAEVHRRSEGVPRVLNTLCDGLLLLCFALDQKIATIEMLDEICEDLRLEWAGHPVASPSLNSNPPYRSAARA